MRFYVNRWKPLQKPPKKAEKLWKSWETPGFLSQKNPCNSIRFFVYSNYMVGKSGGIVCFGATASQFLTKKRGKGDDRHGKTDRTV